MIWQMVRTYWKRITGIIIGAATLIGALWALSGYVVRADDKMDQWDQACVVAQVAKDQSDEALEWQRLQMERERAEERAERKKWRAILKMCMDGTITDKKVCAEATAALK
jgi:hypothetical protein